jgi:hypothetical protein
MNRQATASATNNDRHTAMTAARRQARCRHVVISPPRASAGERKGNQNNTNELTTRNLPNNGTYGRKLADNSAGERR